MTWSFEECTEQRGSDRDILKGNYVCACMRLVRTGSRIKLPSRPDEDYAVTNLKHKLNLTDKQLYSPAKWTHLIYHACCNYRVIMADNSPVWPLLSSDSPPVELIKNPALLPKALIFHTGVF